jgi:hypothetical protein
MSSLFSANAYNVLGLDVSAPQKEVTKRAKEIINLIKIDETPEYNTDIAIASPKRDETGVKDALQKISSPTKRIKDYFFWFDIENDVDEKALRQLQDEQFDDAIATWKSQIEKDSTRSFTAKKNLAVLGSVLLVAKGQKKYLSLSIGMWRDLIESDKFWAHFEKVYALNDEVGTSKSALEHFRKDVVNELSDFYTDVSQQLKDNTYYSSFSTIFGVKGQKMQDNVLAPIFEKINDTADKLRALNISDDNIITPEEVAALKRLVKKLQDNFQELRDLGLYSDSQSKTMRDKAAEAIRTVSLDLFNNLGESSKSVALLSIALKIAGTPGLIDKLNRDMASAKQLMSNEKIVKPINDLMSDENYSEALDLIIAEKEKHTKDKDLTEYFEKRIQWCVTALATKHFIETKKIFEKENYEKAAPRFNNVRDFIEQYIESFNFNNDSLQDVLDEVRRMMATPQPDMLKKVDDYRESVVSKAADTFKDQYEETILIILIDSIIYGRMSEMMPEIRKKNHRSKLMGWFWWIVIIGFFLFIGGAFKGGSSDSGSSGSSGTSVSSSCSTELTDMKSKVDAVEAEMAASKAADDTEAYNLNVPEQNRLVAEYNAKLTECR